MHDIKSFLANLSHHPGVYQMLGEKGEILYVGKAKDLKKRVSSYFNNKNKDSKTAALLKQTQHIDVTITGNENEAVLLECNLIKKSRPRYNVLLRDDKSYPYILISKHLYPRITLYRGSRKKDGLYFGPYPSAFAVRETISVLQKIFRIRTCRDSYYAARIRPCLLYQIGRCTGPCVGLISAEEYAQNVRLAILFLKGKSHSVIDELQQRMEESATILNFEAAAQRRDQINRLRQIQDQQYINVAEGEADVIGLATAAGQVSIQLLTIRNGQILGSRSYHPNTPAHSIPEEIISAFLTQHYLNDSSHIESIPKLIVTDVVLSDRVWLENVLAEQSKHKVEIMRPLRGEKRNWLTMAIDSAKQSLSLHIFSKSNVDERLKALQQLLQLPILPRRLECFDISHSSGEATVASCVVFDPNGPVKSDYRRFNINDITPGDDVAAMYQVLSRRFKRLQKDEVILPDVVFIDGGITQLAAAEKALNELDVHNVLLVSVSKGPHRKAGLESIHFLNRPPMHLPADSAVLHFIQQIRDEAHRFAITGHRQRRDKTRRQSSLELIGGIGAKRRRELLRYFGGIQGIAHASLNELMKVPGIHKSLAERIFAALHDTTL
jgi:excinuclease ABC subunit C